MSDFTTCANCGRAIDQDEHFDEDRNDYGYPVAICDQCQNRSAKLDYFTYNQLPPGGCS